MDGMRETVGPSGGTTEFMVPTGQDRPVAVGGTERGDPGEAQHGDPGAQHSDRGLRTAGLGGASRTLPKGATDFTAPSHQDRRPPGQQDGRSRRARR